MARLKQVVLNNVLKKRLYLIIIWWILSKLFHYLYNFFLASKRPPHVFDSTQNSNFQWFLSEDITAN